MPTAGTSVLAGPETLQLLDFLARLEPVDGADLAGSLRSLSTNRSSIGVTVLTGAATERSVRQATGLSGRDRVVVLAEVRPDAASSTAVRGDLQRIQAIDGADFARIWNGTVRW